MVFADVGLGEAQNWTFSDFFVPALILLIVVALLMVVRFVASRYKKIPPSSVGVFYGRKYTGSDGQVRGFRIVSGGGSILMPIVEHLEIMSTAAFEVSINEEGIPNQDNVKVNVLGVATCKLSTLQEDLYNAVQAFLGKGSEELQGFVANILKGHLRSIIGKLDINELLRNRDTFNLRVVEESTEELKRLGVQIITLVIQEVSDVHGYIDALGKQAVAEAVRNAEIKVAEAKAETQKRVSDADRDAAITVANNVVAVAAAQKDRDVKASEFKVQADTAKAQADQALGIAVADQQRTLLVKEAERDAAQKEAQISVQRKEAERREVELEATVVKAAEADKKRRVIEAQASNEVAVLTAEASARASIKRAEGEKAAQVLDGEGHAAKTKAIMLAEAEGEAAKRLQVLMADAEGEAAKKKLALLGEAEGTKELARALAEMNESTRLILILDRLPLLMDHGGDAVSKIAASVFASIAEPLGNIQELRIVDFGGNGKGLDQVANLVPNVASRFLAGLSAHGLDVTSLLKSLGVRADGATSLVGGSTVAGAAVVEDNGAPAVVAKAD